MIGRNKALRRLIGIAALLALLCLAVQQVTEMAALSPAPQVQQAPLPAVQDEEQGYIIGGSPYLLVQDVPYTGYTASFPPITK